jgi:hypothetical protein
MRAAHAPAFKQIALNQLHDDLNSAKLHAFLQTGQEQPQNMLARPCPTTAHRQQCVPSGMVMPVLRSVCIIRINTRKTSNMNTLAPNHDCAIDNAFR